MGKDYPWAFLSNGFEGLARMTGLALSTHYTVEEKDSGRWLEVLGWANVHQAIHPSVLLVADREADFYEYLAQPRLGHIELLVRVQHLPRRVHWQGQTRPLAQVKFFERGQRVVEMPAASGREARQATLWVDAQAVEFPPTPQRQGPNLPCGSFGLGEATIPTRRPSTGICSPLSPSKAWRRLTRCSMGTVCTGGLSAFITFSSRACTSSGCNSTPSRA